MKRKTLLVIVGLLLAAGLVYQFVFNARQDAPDVAVKTLTGETVRLSQLRGKAVLVNFWATDCATCIKEMPRLVQLHRDWQGRGLELIAVAMQYDRPDYVLHYTQANRLPFKVALDTTGEAAQAFGGIMGTPTTFIIDRQGRISKRYVGEPAWPELERWLRETLGAPE